MTLDKGYNEMSKFLNRILGMHVEKQNLLFKYFSDTLAAIIQQAKRSGRYDQVMTWKMTFYACIYKNYIYVFRVSSMLE